MHTVKYTPSYYILCYLRDDLYIMGIAKKKVVATRKKTTKKKTIKRVVSKMPIYQFQIGQRKINIKAKTQKEAEKKAVAWKNKNAKNSILAYNFRVD